MQQDANKTNTQLLDELRDLRQRNTELEAIISNLKESEEHFRRAIAEASVEAIYTVDQNGTIVFWNKAATKLFGYEENEALGRSNTMLLPERFKESDSKARKQISETGVFSFKGKLNQSVAVRKDGTEFPVEITITDWKVNDRRYFTAILRDITERKQHEEMLREREERFRTIAESSPDAIITADSSGKILYWNKAAETIYGYKAEEIVGKSAEVLEPEAMRPIYRKKRDSLVKDGYSSFVGKTAEAIGIRKDGSEVPVEISSSYWKIGGQIVFCGIVRDITKRKEAEESLRRSNAILQAINVGTTTLICVKDKKGKIIMANPAMLNFIGKSESEVIGKDDLDFIADAEQAARIRENDYHIMKSRRPQTVEETVDWPDRRWICLFNKSPYLDAHGDVIGVIGVGTDITERKRAENLLLQEKNFSDTLINSLPGVFYLLDDQQKLIRWNKLLEKVTRYSAKELQNLNALALTHEDDRALVVNKIKEVFVNGQGETEARLLGKHGKESHYFFTGRRLDIEGKSYLTGVGIDITELKQMGQKLQKAHDELEKKVKQRTAELSKANKQLQISREHLKKYSGKLLSVREEERKNIATTIHDELGSMAIAVDSQISIAAEECNENNKQGTFKALKKAQAALRKAVEDLRRLAVDLRPPNLEIMGLNEALTDLFNNVKKHSPLKITFRNDLANKKIPEDMAIVIYRVIQEALTNVAKHAKAQKVAVRLGSDKNKVHLNITDDGIGFDVDKVLKRRGKINIGMEGMRERVESLGGELMIKSAFKEGTQLKATLQL